MALSSWLSRRSVRARGRRHPASARLCKSARYLAASGRMAAMKPPRGSRKPQGKDRWSCPATWCVRSPGCASGSISRCGSTPWRRSPASGRARWKATSAVPRRHAAGLGAADPLHNARRTLLAVRPTGRHRRGAGERLQPARPVPPSTRRSSASCHRKPCSAPAPPSLSSTTTLRLTWRALSAALSRPATAACAGGTRPGPVARARLWPRQGVGPGAGASAPPSISARRRTWIAPARASSPRRPSARTRQRFGVTLVQRRARAGARGRSGGPPDRTRPRDRPRVAARHHAAGLDLRLSGRQLGAMRGLQRLMPFDALRHRAFIGMGCAHFAAGRYERAAVWAKSGVEAFGSLLGRAHRDRGRHPCRRAPRPNVAPRR